VRATSSATVTAIPVATRQDLPKRRRRPRNLRIRTWWRHRHLLKQEALRQHRRRANRRHPPGPINRQRPVHQWRWRVPIPVARVRLPPTATAIPVDCSRRRHRLVPVPHPALRDTLWSQPLHRRSPSRLLRAFRLALPRPQADRLVVPEAQRPPVPNSVPGSSASSQRLLATPPMP